MADWPDDECDVCGADISGGESHYHCPSCAAVVSMMGHDCDIPPQTAQALRSLADGLGGRIICLLTPANDMEAVAERYNRWYAKAHPARLAVDGPAYRRRCLARRRRR